MKPLEYNTILRTDIGDLLVHWTRKRVWYEDDLLEAKEESAFDVLNKILDQGKLLGSGTLIKGKYKCICFTESPIANIVKVFALNRAHRFSRYEPYGIGIRKEWLYNMGGRPVIYGDSNEYNILSPALRWRFMEYNPPKTDFTWEREWRINSIALDLNPNEIVIIVPERKHVLELTRLYGNKYLILALSVLGLVPEEENPSFL